MKCVIAAFLAVSSLAYAGRLPAAESTEGVRRTPLMPSSSSSSPSSRLENLRMQHRFGVGVRGAGPLAVFGLSADVNLNEDMSLGIGVGTGIDFTTWMADFRWYLLGEWISPYLGVGVARWWSEGTSEKRLGPSILPSQFLGANEDPSKGFSVFLFYPTIGVQFMHPAGFAFSLELQQMFRFFSMGNGTYGGFGFHWYI